MVGEGCIITVVTVVDSGAASAYSGQRRVAEPFVGITRAITLNRAL